MISNVEHKTLAEILTSNRARGTITTQPIDTNHDHISVRELSEYSE